VRNERDDERRPSGTAPPVDAEVARPDRPSAAGFFLAVYRSTAGASRIYRVYPDADGLSFLGLGPPHPWIDLESARKSDSTHWAVRTSRLVRKGVAMAIAGGSAVVGILALALLRAAFKDAPKVLDILLSVLTAAGVFAPLALLVLATSVRLFTSRVAHLDSLTREQIRDEAGRKTLYSFRAAAAEIASVSIDPAPAQGAMGKSAALLSFTLGPSGKWKMELVSREDTKAAARSFRQLLGPDGVAVNVRLKRD
jgi:hypothetical protein